MWMFVAKVSNYFITWFSFSFISELNAPRNKQSRGDVN